MNTNEKSKVWVAKQISIVREGRSASFYEKLPDNAVTILLIILKQFTEANPVPGMEFEVQFSGIRELFEKGFLRITQLPDGGFKVQPSIPGLNHELGFPEFKPANVQ